MWIWPQRVGVDRLTRRSLWSRAECAQPDLMEELQLGECPARACGDLKSLAGFVNPSRECDDFVAAVSDGFFRKKKKNDAMERRMCSCLWDFDM